MSHAPNQLLENPARRGPIRVALYSHDTMGLGHLRRNLAIARSLADSPLHVTALLVTGARQASAFEFPRACECFTLPALHKNSDGSYRSRSLDLSLADLVELRSASIRAALEAFAPDVLIVDKLPRGFMGELDAALKSLRERNGTHCILGLRDVLDDADAVRRDWCDSDSARAVVEYFDDVWVYGDPSVYDPIEECDALAELAPRATYTGYLSPALALPNPAAPKSAQEQVALCLVGGGQDGEQLARAFAASRLPRGMRGVIVTGPYMPDDSRRRLQHLASKRPRMCVLEFLPELAPLIARASHIVAMGGYNTVSELLGCAKRVLIVPRVQPRREQAIRAERLRSLGCIDVVYPEQLHADLLSKWLRVEIGEEGCDNPPIDLRGLTRLPSLLASVLQRGFPTPAVAS